MKMNKVRVKKKTITGRKRQRKSTQTKKRIKSTRFHTRE
jgi:hypothetical protein